MESGLDEIASAFMADAYSRTYRSKAVTLAEASGPVVTKRGLVLLPDDSGESANVDHFVSIEIEALPVTALDSSLQGIRARYGDRVASFVAL